MMDNPNNKQFGEINKYIKALDSRLSIPKFDAERQSLEILRRSFTRNSNASLPRQNSLSKSPKRLVNPESPRNLQEGTKLKSYLDQGLNSGSVMKLQNASSPRDMKSQN